MRSFLKFAASTFLTIGLLVPTATYGMQAAAEARAGKTGPKSAPAAAASAQEIADAKSKGMVWVNLSTRVYHKDGAYYGNTKRGKFMTEDEATKAGYRAAKESGGKRKAAAKP